MPYVSCAWVSSMELLRTFSARACVCGRSQQSGKHPGWSMCTKRSTLMIILNQLLSPNIHFTKTLERLGLAHIRQGWAWILHNLGSYTFRHLCSSLRVMFFDFSHTCNAVQLHLLCEKMRRVQVEPVAVTCSDGLWTIQPAVYILNAWSAVFPERSWAVLGHYQKQSVPVAAQQRLQLIPTTTLTTVSFVSCKLHHWDFKKKKLACQSFSVGWVFQNPSATVQGKETGTTAGM